ncbi:MAG: nitroreductase [Christensenellaceae bacterium]|nr:nitroreductase [Christensenellaceae bacterium]
MNTLDTLFSRKSVRSYTGEQITAEELEVMLKSANAAPIGMGRYENIHITIIQNPDLLYKIDAAAAAMFNNPNIHPLYKAPTLILVSSKRPDPNNKSMENIAFSNAAIVAHNMVLAATELDLGACYIWGATAAISKKSDLIAELNLPENFIPCCAVALGKTDEKYSVREIPLNRITKNEIL